MTPGVGTESTLVTDIAFWMIAACIIVASLGVVQLRDLFRSAMSLVVAFLGIAGLFVLLRAEFLAVVQVLIYVGAISVLIVFAILMTRDVERGSPPNRLRIPAAILACLFFATTSVAAVGTEWSLLSDAFKGESLIGIEEIYSNTVPSIAELLLRDFVLAFEVASVLLLAAIIGALALVRER